jgi:hypothetical protein
LLASGIDGVIATNSHARPQRSRRPSAGRRGWRPQRAPAVRAQHRAARRAGPAARRGTADHRRRRHLLGRRRARQDRGRGQSGAGLHPGSSTAVRRWSTRWRRPSRERGRAPRAKRGVWR